MTQHELAAPKPIHPQSVSDVERIAALAVKSGLISLKTPEAAFFVIMTGLELGLSPMTALRSVHVVDGKPVLSAALMVALAKRHPDCLYFMLVESSPDGATYETRRRGDPAPTRKSWLWADAKQAGLCDKTNWKKHPTAMLEARCSAALARAVYPDLLLGVYEESEGEEIRENAKPERYPHGSYKREGWRHCNKCNEISCKCATVVAVEAEVLPALPLGSLSAGADAIERDGERRNREWIAACKTTAQVDAAMASIKDFDAVLFDLLRPVGVARRAEIKAEWQAKAALPDARRPLPSDHISTPSEAQEPAEVITAPKTNPKF